MRSRLHLGVWLGLVVGLGALGGQPALARPSQAQLGRILPLSQVSGLQKPRTEKAVRLANARVVLADYPLIRHDFQQPLEARFAKPLSAISEREIDEWLLDSTAYVSAAQAKQSLVNTPIPTTERSVTAFRPMDYGRAMVFQPEPGVLIDVKGSGAKRPRQTDHANGLATLGEVIREFAYEQLVHKLFVHAQSGERTVGHYAVIDAGFDVKFGDGRQDRAGLILRQAHTRAKGDKSALSIPKAMKIERVLRRYGITSAGAYQEEPYDALNIQGTRDGALLDFGGFLAMPWFEKPAYHFDHTPDVEPHRKPIFAPKQEFPQPDEAHRVPFNTWGFSMTRKADPIADNPWIWSHDLARDLANGKAQRQHAEQHLRNLLDPVEQALKN
jgi:hypothetical protein